MAKLWQQKGLGAFWIEEGRRIAVVYGDGIGNRRLAVVREKLKSPYMGVTEWMVVFIPNPSTSKFQIRSWFLLCELDELWTSSPFRGLSDLVDCLRRSRS
jgi:hypothetical protein